MSLPRSLQKLLIVSHGQPSDWGSAAAELRSLADQVAHEMPDWVVRCATLAEDGALARAVLELGTGGVVYPMFMAGGWFVNERLPQELAQAGGADWPVLTPFGVDPLVHDLAVTLLKEAGVSRFSQVLIAAHGSFKSDEPSKAAYALASYIRQKLQIDLVQAAFIDQNPRICDCQGFFIHDAFCLPFFAANGGHIRDDVPEALKRAGFGGTLLKPLGLDFRVPKLIAKAVRAAAG